jgi:hypothetical protein
VAFAEEGDEAVADLVFLVDDRASNVGHHGLGNSGDYIGGQGKLLPIQAIIGSDRDRPISLVNTLDRYVWFRALPELRAPRIH